jgi:osmotically-inducible protein OsmY
VRKLVSALALVVAIAGLGQAAPVVKPSAVVPKTPDAQIERNIRARFAKSKINADHFTVAVRDGIATLDGKTGVIQHKGVATRLAKTGGAAAVQNHIQISEEARAKAAANLAKNRGGTQLARAAVIQPSKPK